VTLITSGRKGAKMNLILVLLALFALLLPVDGHAFKCSATTTPLNFSNYDVFSTLPLDSTGNVTISCTNPEAKPVQVEVTISSGSSGSFNPRQMALAGASDRMNYYLFLDASKTTIWGDGTGGTATFTSTVVRNPTVNAVIYGRVPARQNLRAGVYSDTLLITVIW